MNIEYPLIWYHNLLNCIPPPFFLGGGWILKSRFQFKNIFSFGVSKLYFLSLTPNAWKMENFILKSKTRYLRFGVQRDLSNFGGPSFATTKKWNFSLQNFAKIWWDFKLYQSFWCSYKIKNCSPYSVTQYKTIVVHYWLIDWLIRRRCSRRKEQSIIKLRSMRWLPRDITRWDRF